MLSRPSFRIGADLTVRLGDVVVALSPREGLCAAERLIRTATRRMVIDEALAAVSASPRVVRRPGGKSSPR